MNFIKPLWQTPVWEFQSHFDSAFNKQLLDECYNIGNIVKHDPNPMDSLWDYAGPYVKELKKYMINTVSDCINNSITEAADLRLKYDCPMAWINVKAPGESIELHAHPDATFAATYYIQAEDGAGDLVLIDTKDFVNGTGPAKEQRITPVAGKLVFFPAYVLHNIEENKSSNLRISLSTDVVLVIDKDAPNALVIKSWCNNLLKIREWTGN
jgi:uncharacterized protein (TIGR02466 family)